MNIFKVIPFLAWCGLVSCILIRAGYSSTVDFGTRLGGTSWKRNVSITPPENVWWRVDRVYSSSSDFVFLNEDSIVGTYFGPNVVPLLQVTYTAPTLTRSSTGNMIIDVTYREPDHPGHDPVAHPDYNPVRKLSITANLKGSSVARNWYVENDFDAASGELFIKVFCRLPQKIDHAFAEKSVVALSWAKGSKKDDILSDYNVGMVASPLFSFAVGETGTQSTRVKIPERSKPFTVALPEQATHVIASVTPAAMNFPGYSNGTISSPLEYAADNFESYANVRHIEKVAGLMEENKLRISAQMQRKWRYGATAIAKLKPENKFDRKKAIVDFNSYRYLQDDVRPLSMQWVRSFYYPANGYKALVSGAKIDSLKTPDSLKLLGEELYRVRKGREFPFGVLRDNIQPEELDAMTVQAQAVQGISTLDILAQGFKFDDFQASINGFTWHLICGGEANITQTDGGVLADVSIKHFGIIGFDSFDFLDYKRSESRPNQLLGVWGGKLVQNGHYNLWRSLIGRGRDMHVATELKKVVLDTPIEIKNVRVKNEK